MALRPLTYSGLLSLFLLFSPPIHAQGNGNDESFHCPEHPAAQWSRSEQLSAKLTKTGYRVEAINTTPGGCYEVVGQTSNNQRVRLQVDPVTLRTLKTDRIP